MPLVEPGMNFGGRGAGVSGSPGEGRAGLHDPAQSPPLSAPCPKSRSTSVGSVTAASHSSFDPPPLHRPRWVVEPNKATRTPLLQSDWNGSGQEEGNWPLGGGPPPPSPRRMRDFPVRDGAIDCDRSPGSQAVQSKNIGRQEPPWARGSDAGSPFPSAALRRGLRVALHMAKSAAAQLRRRRALDRSNFWQPPPHSRITFFSPLTTH